MKSVNYFGKEYVDDGKWIFAASKLSDFSIITNFQTLIDILLDFIDQFNGRKREYCTFRPDDYYYLILFDIFQYSFLNFAFK